MKAALAILVAAGVLRLTVAATTGIVEDEAYYWVWSTRLDAGYYDHPPAVAWFIAASARLFGASSFGVRAFPVLVGTAASALLLRHAKNPALFAAAVATMPLFTLGGVLATPDVPMLVGWTIALRGALDGRWWLAGLGAGLAGLGKYSGYGLWPLLLLSAPREWRRMLPGLGLTLGVIAPNLWWNARHDWVSLAFQLGHGLSSKAGGAGAFFGAQVGLVSPLLFLAWGLFALVAWRNDREDRIAWWTSVPVLVFFTLAATRGAGEANWAAPAWIGGMLGVARATPRVQRLGWVGVGLAGLLSGLVILHLYVPLVHLPRDPTARLGLGRDLAASVQAWGEEAVWTTRYQEAALLRYYAGVPATTVPETDRVDQFDLWPRPDASEGLFVRPHRSGSTLVTDRFCADHGPANVVTEHDVDGTVLDRWQVYEVRACQWP